METLKEVYKSLNGLAASFLATLLTKLSEVEKRELRNTKANLVFPLRKTAMGQKAFSYKGDKMWNDLGVGAKQSRKH